MADDQASAAGRTRPTGESEAARRKRLDEVFGDVLPETTNDERDDRDDRGGDATDRWLREQVPPHHGG
jgi:hypothetical protein